MGAAHRHPRARLAAPLRRAPLTRPPGAELALRVTPRADADRVGPFVDGQLEVRVTRPPADGDANRAVVRLVANALGVPPSSVTLVAGARSRRKRCRIAGISPTELDARLRRLGD